MIHRTIRRLALAGLALLAPLAGRARDWRQRFKQSRVGRLGGENTPSRLARYDGFQRLLQANLGIPVKPTPAADHVGVMQAKAAGQVDLSEFSPSAFAGAWLDCDRQYDAGVTWTSGPGDIAQGFGRGAPPGVVDRGMLKMSDVNVIWKSGERPNGPWGLRSALPAGVKAMLAACIPDVAKSHKDIRDAVEQGLSIGDQLATLDQCKDIIERREPNAKGSRR